MSMPLSVASQKSGKQYFLHERLQKLKGGQEVLIYFFAGAAREGAIEALPEGYEVLENPTTGLPFLKKKRKAAQEEALLGPTEPLEHGA